MIGYSGIITLFTSGIMLTHYAYYNLSERSRQTINLQFGTIGFGAEAFVFAYMGITFFSFSRFDWSITFIIFEFVFVLIARFAGSVCLYYLVTSVFCLKRGLNFKELLFLNFAGVIRGAIAFGLVLKMDHNLDNRSVIITTVLTVVITSTIIFGALMTVLKGVLLDGGDHKNLQALNASYDSGDSPHQQDQLMKMNEVPMLELNKKTDGSTFSKSYAENKFSTSYVTGFMTEEHTYKKNS